MCRWPEGPATARRGLGKANTRRCVDAERFYFFHRDGYVWVGNELRVGDGEKYLVFMRR